MIATTRHFAVGGVALVSLLAVLASARCDAQQSEEGRPREAERLRTFAAPKPLPAGAVTEDVQRLFGANVELRSRETKLLRNLAAGPAKVWSLTKGTGYASPVVSGGKVVLFHRIGDELIVECVDAATGAPIWKRSRATDFRDPYGFNNGPRATPVIDGDRVFVHGPSGVLAAHRMSDGEPLWQVHTSERFKVPENYFGVGSTPLAHGDSLIVNVGGAGGESVVAFDKASGEVRWIAKHEWGASYASPMIRTFAGTESLLVFAGGPSRPPSGGLLLIDPSSGAVRSSFPLRSKRYESVNASNPVVGGDRVFITSSYRTGAALLEVTGGTSLKKVWAKDVMQCHFGTPVLVGNHLFGFDGSGKNDTYLQCIAWDTGEQVWREMPEWTEKVSVSGQVRDVSYTFGRGSILFADGDLLILGEEGHLAWAKASASGYEEISRTRLFIASETWTPPVVSRGLLYVMQNNKDAVTGAPPALHCYDLRSGD